jgi:hypothetical protein
MILESARENTMTNAAALTVRLLSQKITGHSYVDGYAACAAIDSAYGLTDGQRYQLAALVRAEYPRD